MRPQFPRLRPSQWFLLDSAGVGLLVQVAIGLWLLEGPSRRWVELVVFVVAASAVVICITGFVFPLLMRGKFRISAWMEPLFPVRGRWLQVPVALGISLLVAGTAEYAVLLLVGNQLAIAVFQVL